jgi:hypothetical protein
MRTEFSLGYVRLRLTARAHFARTLQFSLGYVRLRLTARAHFARTLQFSVAIAIASLLAIGCNGNECEQADSRLGNCVGQQFGQAACSGRTLCLAKCINAASCDQIQAANSVNGYPNAYLSCNDGCTASSTASTAR